MKIIHYSASKMPREKIANTFNEISPFFSVPAGFYPNFGYWHMKLSREIFTPTRSLLVAYDKEKIAAFSVLKHSKIEKKICTFFVLESYRSFGIGHRLLRESISVLGNSNILITVADEVVDQLAPLLLKFDFTLVRKLCGYYRQNLNEYIFKRNTPIPHRVSNHIFPPSPLLVGATPDID